MSVFFRRSAGVFFACSIANGAWADLTASDVWSDWKAYMGGMGYQVGGSENQSGGTLTVTDMTMSMEMPEEDGSGTLTIPEVTFTENGDGTVSIDFPESFPMTLSFAADPGEAVEVVMTYAMSNMNMSVAGDPSDMTYSYTADTLNLSVDSVTAEGETLPEGALDIRLDMAGVSGTAQMIIGELRDLVQEFSANSMTYIIAFDDPESDDGANLNGQLNNVTYSGTGSIPKTLDTINYADFFNSGFAFDGNLSYGSGSGSMQGKGEGEEFAFTSKSQGGDFRVGMTGEKLVYDVAQRGAEISVTTQELPFPVDIKMAEVGFKMDMPVQQGDAPQPFGFGLNLTDFTMSDMIWGMFDPAGALPRDPATIVLDATGTAKVLVNFMDPTVAETLEATGAAPGELNSLKINELLISLVGASLSGTGDFEFDNSNLEEFDGMPAPSGVADLKLVGANALIDKLIAMGFVSDQDAMGARMMMGMLAVPGDQPDTLNSRIEINKQGHIMANGQRIK